MLTIHDRPEIITFYHGTSIDLGSQLLPPEATGKISEKGRNKNLDRVFFTRDIGLAKVYARRSARSQGGSPRLYRVVCPVDTQLLSAVDGATVYHAAFAFVEEIEENIFSNTTFKR